MKDLKVIGKSLLLVILLVIIWIIIIYFMLDNGRGVARALFEASVITVVGTFMMYVFYNDILSPFRMRNRISNYAKEMIDKEATDIDDNLHDDQWFKDNIVGTSDDI